MRPLCQVCGVKWGKNLVIGCCVCSGHVPISFKGPDPLVPRQTKQEPLKQGDMKETGPKIGKKERERLEKYRSLFG
jgi:hypothetical protein